MHPDTVHLVVLVACGYLLSLGVVLAHPAVVVAEEGETAGDELSEIGHLVEKLLTAVFDHGKEPGQEEEEKEDLIAADADNGTVQETLEQLWKHCREGAGGGTGVPPSQTADAARNEIVRMGGHVGIVRAMKKYPNDEMIQYTGCSVLGKLAEGGGGGEEESRGGGGVRRRSLVGQAGGAEAMVAALRRFPPPPVGEQELLVPNVPRAACTGLHRLLVAADDDDDNFYENKNRIVRAGGAQALADSIIIIGVMDEQRQQQQQQRGAITNTGGSFSRVFACTRALAELVSFSPSPSAVGGVDRDGPLAAAQRQAADAAALVVKEAVAQAGGTVTALKVMQMYPDHSDLRTLARSIITALRAAGQPSSSRRSTTTTARVPPRQRRTSSSYNGQRVSQ